MGSCGGTLVFDWLFSMWMLSSATSCQDRKHSDLKWASQSVDDTEKREDKENMEFMLCKLLSCTVSVLGLEACKLASKLQATSVRIEAEWHTDISLLLCHMYNSIIKGSVDLLDFLVLYFTSLSSLQFYDDFFSSDCCYSIFCNLLYFKGTFSDESSLVSSPPPQNMPDQDNILKWLQSNEWFYFAFQRKKHNVQVQPHSEILKRNLNKSSI